MPNITCPKCSSDDVEYRDVETPTETIPTNMNLIFHCNECEKTFIEPIKIKYENE